MFCIHCGAPNPEDASFCGTCGKAIGARANPPEPVETPQRVPVSAERSSGNAPPWTASGQTPAPTPIPAQPIPQAQMPYQPAAAGKGKPVLWILGGFGACVLIVITVAVAFRLGQASPGQGNEAANSAPSTSPSSVPVTETSTAPTAENTPAPMSAPAPAPAPPAPAATPAPAQNTIVGDWKTTTMIGSSIELHFGADGRYTLKDVLDSQEGVYVFSSGDGTLRLQPKAVFSHDIVVWSCQLMGDSLSCVDPNGTGHVYSRQ